jgi:hypothetical protein
MEANGLSAKDNKQDRRSGKPAQGSAPFGFGRRQLLRASHLGVEEGHLANSSRVEPHDRDSDRHSTDLQRPHRKCRLVAGNRSQRGVSRGIGNADTKTRRHRQANFNPQKVTIKGDAGRYRHE